MEFWNLGIPHQLAASGRCVFESYQVEQFISTIRVYIAIGSNVKKMRSWGIRIRSLGHVHVNAHPVSPQKMDHLRDFIQPSNVKLVGADHQKLLQNFNALPISSSAKSPCCQLWQVVARLLLPHLQREPAISGLSSSAHPTTSNALLFIHNPVTETATWRRSRPPPSAARPRQGISAHKRQEREED